MIILKLLTLIAVSAPCSSYKILAVFPYNGVSHHIYYTPLIEELATKHQLTVINYLPLRSNINIRQISLHKAGENKTDAVNIKEFYNGLPQTFREFFFVYKSSQVFKEIATDNCRRMMTNKDIIRIVKTQKFDLVLLEQFVSDCGFAFSHHLKAPVVGITAHVLMPWTYGRLGAQNPPSVTPNHFMGTGTTLTFWETVKSYLITLYLDLSHTYSTQAEEHDIIKEVLPDTPDLETLSKSISLILLNQFVPLTGSRLYGANVVEVGGLHIKEKGIADEELQTFLDGGRLGVIYVSLGTVASELPENFINAILHLAANTNFRFVWKIDKVNTTPKNIFIRKWLPQVDILCHKNVRGFISHSGMLSTSEAMHCGVPIISVPLFGDQFANAASARECGLGVTLDLEQVDGEKMLNALDVIMHQKYQSRAKKLSTLWKDRPDTPLNTAVYWIEYVARNQNATHLIPVTVNIPKYMLEWVVIFNSVLIGLYVAFIILKKPSNYIKLIPQHKKRS